MIILFDTFFACIFWEKQYLKFTQRWLGFYLLGFLLSLFFDPEDGGLLFLQNVVDFQQPTLRRISEDGTLRHGNNIFALET
jgi:hypothetical protein